MKVELTKLIAQYPTSDVVPIRPEVAWTGIS